MGTPGKTGKDYLFENWFNSHYLQIILLSLLVFTLLPVLAPVLMKFEWHLPARIIYWVYSNLCHQLPYRSWFLFGPQFNYPLDIVQNNSIDTFSNAFDYAGNLERSRSVIGNATVGYKIAVCQRDLAMYTGLLVFGLIYSAARRKIVKIPLWVWFVCGVIPLAIDGLTQLGGSISFVRELLPLRESTAFLRTLTGGLFGVFTGWFVFPYLEKLMKK